MNTNKLTQADFLGRGLGFPPSFDKSIKHSGSTAGDIVLVEGEQDIQESLQILLSTRPGERLLRPDYGCNLDQLLFEPLTVSLIALMQDVVKTAVISHEPRIFVNEVRIESVDNLEGQILIHIDYTIRTNNSRFNFVFPFYIQEGTDISR